MDNDQTSDQEPTLSPAEARRANLRIRGAAAVKTLAGNRQAHRAAHRADPQPTTQRPNSRLKDPDTKVEEIGIEPHPLLALSPVTDDPATSAIDKPFSVNTGKVIPQTTPALVLGGSYEHDILRHALLQLYLRGYTRDAMAKKLGIARKNLRGHLEAVRASILNYMEENPEVFGAPLEALYLQVLRRRERQSALWEELGSPDQHMESVRPQFYRLLAEEDKAIEGLLGLDHKTVSLVVGTPMEQAQADLLRTMGPDKLKELLVELRETHELLSQEGNHDQQASSQGSTIIIEGTSSVFTG